MGYIYKIENLINHKKYIGLTTKADPKERFREHIKLANENAKYLIHKALFKYGVENFSFEILEEVSKNVEVDIPEPMVDEEVNRLLKRFEEQMKMQGISLDLYYQFTNSNEEALKSQMEKEAYSNVLYRLMLEEIMNLEKIEVSSEEAEKEAEELAKKYQMEKDEFLAQFGGIEMIQYDLEMRKAIELLKELNK